MQLVFDTQKPIAFLKHTKTYRAIWEPGYNTV